MQTLASVIATYWASPLTPSLVGQPLLKGHTSTLVDALADTDLTSDVSAVIAFVNGYYISKAATAQTYADNTTTYLWLTQAGAYVQSTDPNTSISNSALLAKVVTSGTQITAVTDLANRRLPGLLLPSQFRTGLYVSRDSTTTITVFPGTTEINSSMLSKTATTTLTLTTAGDWAGGSSLQATSTFGYVGMDSSGNLKMHTTAPTHQNYALTVTAGKKRYATWSSTVYRILGWFYMNATGAGELNTYEVGNIKEADVANSVVLNSDTFFTTSSTTMVADTSGVTHFYSSGNPIEIKYHTAGVNDGGTVNRQNISVDSVGIAAAQSSLINGATGNEFYGLDSTYQNNFLAQGTHTVQGVVSVAGSNFDLNRRSLMVEEK